MIGRDKDTILFIEIVESIKGVLFIRSDEFEGAKIRVYEGINGRTVFIDVSEEDIDEITCKNYLIKLGIDYLIEALFPITPPQISEPTPEAPIAARQN